MNKEITPIPSWDNFNKWWKSQPAQADAESLRGFFSDHPLFTTAMRMNRSITGVLDLHTMKYLYWSGNVIDLLGWDDSNYWEGGALFAYSKFHLDDLLSLEYFGQLIGNYYKSLPQSEKPNYKAFWDFRFIKQDGNYVRILQQDCVLKDDAEGNIAILLLLVTDITNLKDNTRSHLRLTNGIESKLYEYRNQEKEVHPLDCPSERELDVFRYISQGYERKQIADKMNITLATVKPHCQHVFKTLHTADAVETINLLKTLGLL
ncbi:MAG: LuxR C-terminal-related transcriptional regulator [Cyclobacteriaceae bacterium]|nr:LuxR C-terminal-related transcriptional regulator [Cyclobacteriaceae bacterium]